MQTILRGTCGSCGKTYRLPDEGRRYRCKGCGGTVSPEGWDDSPGPLQPELHPAPVHHTSALERRRVIDERRRVAARKRMLIWGPGLVALAGTVVAIQLTRPAAVHAGGVPRDLDAAATELVQRWNAGDVDGLAQVFHPAGLDAFRDRLTRMVDGRGWTAGFPTARHVGSRIVEGTPDEPAKAATVLAIGDAGAELEFAWQFEPLHDRWYAYAMDVPPPPLEPVVARLHEAWEQSSFTALLPFFDPESSVKVREAITRRARLSGWGSRFPALGASVTSGAEKRQTVADRAENVPVDTFFDLPTGKLRVRWRFRPETDAWSIGAVTFPRD